MSYLLAEEAVQQLAKGRAVDEDACAGRRNQVFPICGFQEGCFVEELSSYTL